MDKKLSPPLRLLTVTWEGVNGGYRGDSWRKTNGALQDALILAICSGMKFEPDDFNYINKNFRPWYWMANDGHMLGEGYYFRAIQANNTSAAIAFEVWKRRKPFITDNVTTSPHWGERGYFTRGRLGCGCQFYWNGEKVTVTSFSKDGTHLVACSYKENEPGEYRAKIKHQYKITVKDLRDLRGEMKKIAKEVEMSVADTAAMLMRNNATIQEAWEWIKERNEAQEDHPQG